MKYFPTLLLFLTFSSLKAQIEFPSSFLQLLEVAQLSISLPTENQFKEKTVHDNELCPYHFSMKMKKGDLEIRYSIQPGDTLSKKINAVPHITTISLISSLASNEDDSVISYHLLSSEDLEMKYQADWGLVAFFRPKEMFSSKKHCKMITLFAQDKGIVHVFYLFNDVSEDLENQKYSIMFNQ